ncbi:cold shock domain-containing protein [Falsarthrobacter nasiphocae]|uniref:CspA family cold shock protein n=1 Tax=Falsarthrobacter nasiphocae TaxID=189863 RepID=A0AAE3YFI0_9MICC|nr:cold shock domain-containing protein [Falsarthrobacter nasiphocae]MDR6891737.1 CspA family cold shock protein [Falsarthrobacter nasiphocae]
MPIGKVKWYDATKGFGRILSEDGDDVFLHVSALEPGSPAPSPGTRMEFDLAQDRRGAQALRARVLEQGPSVVRNTRKSAADMAVITEDLIKLLDGVSNGLRRGRYPEDVHARKTAALLRAVADQLDA